MPTHEERWYDTCGFGSEEIREDHRSMTLRGKSVEQLREELQLINRTIQALEHLGRLRLEIPARPLSMGTQPNYTPRARKIAQTH